MDAMVLEAILRARIEFMWASRTGGLFTHFDVNGTILDGSGAVPMQIAG